MSRQDVDRDRSIEAMLKQALRTSAPAERDRCLDAESLAAWIDGDLTAAEIAAAEGHVATCGRCQAMVAAIVRAAPPVAAAVPWWRRRWAIGSLVPLTAGAIALAIWIARPEITRGPSPADAQRVATKETPSAPPPAASAPAAAGVEQQKKVTEAPPKPTALADRMSTPPSANEVKVDAANRERIERKDELAASARRDQGFAAQAPMPARAAAPVAAPSAARAEALESRVAVMADAAAAKHAIAPIEIRSPNPSIRWRIGASGLIERSGNGGTTWSASPSGVTEDLTAGVAPLPTVCWVVGRRGTVLLSADGLQWRRLAFPDTADLATVQATDALTATVATADNRRFRTADGGQTWTPLQEF